MWIDISWPLGCCFKVGRYNTPARCRHQQTIDIRLQATVHMLLRQCEVQKKCIDQHIQYLVRKELFASKLANTKFNCTLECHRGMQGILPIESLHCYVPWQAAKAHNTPHPPSRHTSCFFLQEHVKMGTSPLTSSTAAVHGSMDSYTDSY